MTAALLLSVLSGVALTGGLAAFVVFLRGSEAPEVPEGPSRAARWAAAHRVELAVSAAGAALVWLLTGVPLGALLVPALVFGVPWLVAATRPDTRRIDKLEALSEWTQRLADVLLLGVGLEQAITGSLRTAPAHLEREITDLVGRLQARWTPADALRAFGDELHDATADKLIAALLLRAADRGPGLARALTDLAESVREEVRQRRTIEADRAKHRATVRWMVLIILGVVVAGLLNPGYTAPTALLRVNSCLPLQREPSSESSGG
ncbi:type II secretion system F family protein [Streptacidiphilus monticola]